MRVEKISLNNGDTRYIVLDDDGSLVEPVNRFIKFKDNAGRSRNTLRAYCYHLAAYFEFLKQKNLSFEEVNMETIASFLTWLQNPSRNVGLIFLDGKTRKLKNVTINVYLNSVMQFYDYLNRLSGTYGGLMQSLTTSQPGHKRKYKGLLHHIGKTFDFDAKYLKLRPEKSEKKMLSKADVEVLIRACNNQRDKLLLLILWETGFRIGECLSLWIEDFVVDGYQINLRDRGELENGAEIKTVTSPRTVDVSADLMNTYMDYLVDFHTDEIDTNFVFFKLSGPNKGKPLEYADVDSLFKRLRKKTGIYVTPHLFRHSHFDLLRRNGWSFEKIQRRGGWADVTTPMNIYSHPTDEEMRDAWEKTSQAETFDLGGDPNE